MRGPPPRKLPRKARKSEAGRPGAPQPERGHPPPDPRRGVISLLQAPTVEWAGTLADAGALAIVLFVAGLLGFLFYKRVIVWGSTCEKLVENERLQKEAAVEEKNEANRTVVRIADDFSGHLRAVLHELSRGE